MSVVEGYANYVCCDYKQMLKNACRRNFGSAPTIITQQIDSFQTDDTCAPYYKSVVVLPNGMRYLSNEFFSTIYDTEDALCQSILRTESSMQSEEVRREIACREQSRERDLEKRRRMILAVKNMVPRSALRVKRNSNQ